MSLNTMTTRKMPPKNSKCQLFTVNQFPSPPRDNKLLTKKRKNEMCNTLNLKILQCNSTIPRELEKRSTHDDTKTIYRPTDNKDGIP